MGYSVYDGEKIMKNRLKNHDQNEFLKLCISSFLVLNAQKIGMEMFILYMCFIHVPNHYTIYKNMIKENFSKSFAYIMMWLQLLIIGK